MTTAQSAECPQCQAPLTLMPERRLCQCAFCGSTFVVQLAEGATPRLVRFESVRSAAAAEAPLRNAQERLADVEMALADVEDEVESTRIELEDAQSAYQRARAGLVAAIAPWQNTTYVAGLLAALAGFAALFVFKGSQRLPGAVIAALLAATGWAFHHEWQHTEGRAQAACQAARDAVAAAQAELGSAAARLEDGLLERELLQVQMLPARAEAASGGGAEEVA